MKKMKMESINRYNLVYNNRCSLPLKISASLGKMRVIRKLSLWILIFHLFSHATSAQEKKIVIVKSSDAPSFRAATEGVKKEIKKSDFSPVFIEYDLSTTFPDDEQIVQKVKDLSPDLIVTIGSRATALLSRRIRDIPIIFSNVMNPVSSGFVRSMWSTGTNLTGASLDIPLKIQLEKFKLIVPHLHRVGVIFTSDSEPIVNEAKKVCKRIGLEMIPVAISSEKEIPEAIESLRERVDGVWGVADTLIFTPQSTQYLLLYTLRNGIPFMGPSPSFVKAGALFTLAWDDKDVGRQSGELALKVLSGKEPKDLPITTPRMIYLILNLRTAEQINLKIPPHIVRVAKEVYQ